MNHGKSSMDEIFQYKPVGLDTTQLFPLWFVMVCVYMFVYIYVPYICIYMVPLFQKIRFFKKLIDSLSD